ncbi:hypothetical protein PC9H_010299 [Pleurotus ostreatus]|uniref:Uncharacterized protein n=1 Tax=Pleurotus ostreatus TaxID=5322 RepID=A0A8H6ZNJ0_PLEOS|nr:uncharacterized protein PC9H_010299 [Pleurotus ostreatus]KAF7424988.1 hypothetical protein PC9H_010299 [Pleurotus ostreatus]
MLSCTCTTYCMDDILESVTGGRAYVHRIKTILAALVPCDSHTSCAGAGDPKFCLSGSPPQTANACNPAPRTPSPPPHPINHMARRATLTAQPVHRLLACPSSPTPLLPPPAPKRSSSTPSRCPRRAHRHHELVQAGAGGRSSTIDWCGVVVAPQARDFVGAQRIAFDVTAQYPAQPAPHPATAPSVDEEEAGSAGSW